MARRAFRRLSRQNIEEPTVNLTPLIDVVFSILIMFIVIAPMLELDQIALADANPEPIQMGVSVQDSGPITVHVRGDNTILFNQRIVDIIELPALFKQEKINHPKAKPQIFHDKRAHFGTYQSIKNAAEAAGFDQMDIILKPA